MMKFKRFLTVIIIVITLFACMNAENKNTKDEPVYSGRIVEVLEVISGKTYTYIRVSENDSEYWAAISKHQVNVGDTLYYTGGAEMRDFKSKELDRTFESILFISEISNRPLSPSATMASAHASSGKSKISNSDISVEPAEGGITIAELYSNSDSYNEKIVIVRGKVVKFSAEIMDRNWVHIQDGTSDNGKNDLTITTDENLVVGDIVTLKGKIAVGKDIGAGYFYEVIMESAKIVK
ncbi:MAG: GW dipeptide domain-containing protein [Melioribacteraceae bacterium]|nr:GW dipeptide domain-containing protein [Melioribacteraceae bacterium]